MTRAKYICNTGYYPVGDRVLICFSDGKYRSSSNSKKEILRNLCNITI